MVPQTRHMVGVLESSPEDAGHGNWDTLLISSE